MRGDAERSEQLRDAINVPVTASDEKAAFHLRLAIEGSPLDIARQVYIDRDTLRPREVPPLIRFSKPEVLEHWRKGAPIPDELKSEFAAWMVNHTARRMAQSDNERRLRASMTAQRALAQSEQECDRRQASAFGRWHLEHWRLADIPAWAPAGEEQPFELQLKAALGEIAAMTSDENERKIEATADAQMKETERLLEAVADLFDGKDLAVIAGTLCTFIYFNPEIAEEFRKAQVFHAQWIAREARAAVRKRKGTGQA